MDKKLPDIFANPIQKKINNIQETYYDFGDRTERNLNQKTIEQKINKIFSSKNFVYKSKVRIRTEEGEKIFTIVGKNSKYLLTIDNKTIPILQIKDIEAI